MLIQIDTDHAVLLDYHHLPHGHGRWRVVLNAYILRQQRNFYTTTTNAQLVDELTELRHDPAARRDDIQAIYHDRFFADVEDDLLLWCAELIEESKS